MGGKVNQQQDLDGDIASQDRWKETKQHRIYALRAGTGVVSERWNALKRTVNLILIDVFQLWPAGHNYSRREYTLSTREARP